MRYLLVYAVVYLTVVAAHEGYVRASAWALTRTRGVRS